MKRASSIKFVKSYFKQILFALFILILNYIDKSNVIIMAAPIVVASGAKAVASNALKKSVVEGAKAGAIKGATEGAINSNNNDESMIKGATKGATVGAAKGAISSSNKTYHDFKSGSKNNDGIIKSSTLTNSNISKLNDSDGSSISSSISNMRLGDKLKSGAKSIFSNVENDKSDENKKSFFTPLLLIGCTGGLLTFVVAILIPVFFISFVSPISDVISGMNVSSTDTEKETGFSAFVEKAKNFFAFGTFSENKDVVSKKAEDIYNDMLQKYDVAIDVPLMLATLYSDMVGYNDGEEITFDDEMLKRLDYGLEVAELQINEGYVTYKCMSKKVNNEVIYYKETVSNIGTENVIESECDSSTVGKYIKSLSNIVGESEEYYEKLLNEKDLLVNIYGKELISTDEDIEEIIENIKYAKSIFSVIYTGSDDDSESAGNLPSELFYDENINFTSPLKGNYSMTSPFGNRTGVFAGMHKGVDMISDDHNIYAAGDGVVTRANTETAGGNVIEITHTTSSGEKYISQYGHLNKFLVSKGDTVKAGDIIGIMGDTGIVSGVHLHFQVWKVEPYTLYNPKNVFTNLN